MEKPGSDVPAQPAILYQELFDYVQREFLVPNLEKRNREEGLPLPVPISKLQVLFPPDGDPIVRINSEVKASAIAKVPDVTKLVVGESYSLDEVGQIERFYLHEDEDLDCGHVTAIVAPDGKWALGFDFRKFQGYAERQLRVAREFLDGARYAFGEQKWSLFTDNLFSAFESAAKGFIWTTPLGSDFTEATGHGLIAARLNLLRKHNMIDQDAVKTFNEISGYRAPARYRLSKKQPRWDAGERWMEEAERFLRRLEENIGRPIPNDE